MRFFRVYPRKRCHMCNSRGAQPLVRPARAVRALAPNCSFRPIAGRMPNMRKSEPTAPSHRPWSGLLRLDPMDRITLRMQTCIIGLWGPHSDRTPYVERERERERLSTHQDSAFCNGRHCLQSPPLLGTSDGPTDPDVYARRLTLGRAKSSVPAAMTAALRSQQSASFFCSNCPNGDTKKVESGECLKFAFLALHAAYETQTQCLATYFDRVGRAEAWVKCGKPPVPCMGPGKVKG